MIHVFHPEVVERNNEAGLVLINHIGSTVTQDTGRDAQYLASDLSMPVIAVDRPGTDRLFRNRHLAETLADPDRYVDAIGTIGIMIDDIAKREGIHRLLVTGRSAGAVGALALTASQSLTRQTSVFAAEPVALEAMTVAEGRRRVKTYQSVQRQLLKESPDIIHPEPPGLTGFAAVRRAVSIPPRYYVDQFHNGKLWATDAVMRYARMIASQLIDVDTTIEFAARSLAGSSSAQLRELSSYGQFRTATQAPFLIISSPNTVHASYDKRSFMSERLRPIVHRLLAV